MTPLGLRRSSGFGAAWPSHLRGPDPDAPQNDPMAHRVGSAVTNMPMAMAEYLMNIPKRAIDAAGAVSEPVMSSDFDPRIAATDVAGEIATMLMGGGAARQFAKGASAANELGIFGGKMAKNAPLDDLAKAEAMEKAGAYPDEVWEQTGWARGADGEWRFEIDDSMATVRDVEQLAPLDKNLWHPQAFEQYPDTRSIDSFVGYSPSMRGEFGRSDAGEGLNAFAPNTADQTSVALHELQHALQKRENFARGGGMSPEFPIADYNRISARINDMIQEAGGNLKNAPPAVQAEAEALRELQRNIAKGGSSTLYRHLAGEVEARNVQKRMNMTAKERREMPPVFTEDVPRSQQIVRRK